MKNKSSDNCLPHWVGQQPEKLLLKMKLDGKGGCTVDVHDYMRTENDAVTKITSPHVQLFTSYT